MKRGINIISTGTDRSRLDGINDGHSCHIQAEIQLQVGT